MIKGRKAGYEQVLARQVKWVRWEDIDDYEADFHDFKVGDTIRALKDAEFSWGFSVVKGETLPLMDNTSLWQLDYEGVKKTFERVDI